MVTDADLPLLSSILIGPTKKRRTKARSRISVNLLQQTKSHAIELLQVNKPWSCRLSPLKNTSSYFILPFVWCAIISTTIITNIKPKWCKNKDIAHGLTLNHWKKKFGIFSPIILNSFSLSQDRLYIYFFLMQTTIKIKSYKN